MATAPLQAGVPPQNLEAEESVLGAMMISPGAIIAVREAVDAGDFYRDSHARIYRAALALHDAGGPVDAITLTEELERRGQLEDAGGRTRLHELARLVPATANARHYAEIVRNTATMRGLIRAGGEIAQLGWDRDGDAGGLVERARTIAEALIERGGHADELRAQTWAEFERDATEHVPVVVDGLWPEGGLGFIAAPPKKGKTWVGIDLAVAVATGTPFLGSFPVPEPETVVYVALEGHRAAIRGRIGALARGHGFNPSMGSDDLKRLHVLYKPVGLNLADPAWTRSIRQLAQRIDARMIVVDVLRAAAVLKENSNDEFRDLVRTLQPITSDGCALALLHHFGKLTEISRDRSPGERMSGAGAMYGAFDVGVFITGSSDHGRKLRIEFETRDLPSPDKIGVELAGTPTGPKGGFIFTDTAYWVETDTPNMDDIKGPAEEIADWVREQGGDVDLEAVEEHFHMSRPTSRRRRYELEELGVDWIIGRGRGARTRLVADIPTQQNLLESSASPLCVTEVRHDALNDVTHLEPLNHAESGLSASSASRGAVQDDAQSETADLQGDLSASNASSPTGKQTPAAAVAHPRETEADDDIDWSSP